MDQSNNQFLVSKMMEAFDEMAAILYEVEYYMGNIVLPPKLDTEYSEEELSVKGLIKQADPPKIEFS